MVPRIWRISAAFLIAAVALVLVAAYTVVASADTDDAKVAPTKVAASAADEDPDADGATDGQKAAAEDTPDEKAGQPEGDATADPDGNAMAPDNGPSNGGAVPDDEKKPADDPTAQKPPSDEGSTEKDPAPDNGASDEKESAPEGESGGGSSSNTQPQTPSQDSAEPSKPTEQPSDSTAEEPGGESADTQGAGVRLEQGGAIDGRHEDSHASEMRASDMWNIDYAVPSWATLGNVDLRGSLSTAWEMRMLEIGLEEDVESVRFLAATRVVPGFRDARIASERDILAIYAVMRGETDGFPYGVTVDSADDAELLGSVYWAANRVTASSSGGLKTELLSLPETGKSLGLSDEEIARAQDLSDTDAGVGVGTMLEGAISSKLTNDELLSIDARIPDGISYGRRAVLEAALSLEGKVDYFWGGKSRAIGWNDSWGSPGIVASMGSAATGSIKPIGLDCSGFVEWAFVNAAGDPAAARYIGTGTSEQIGNSYPVKWNEVKPGDLLFLAGTNAGALNHVGIVLSVNDDGTPREVVHCSGSAGNVVVTGPNVFTIARRPYVYGE